MSEGGGRFEDGRRPAVGNIWGQWCSLKTTERGEERFTHGVGGFYHSLQKGICYGGNSSFSSVSTMINSVSLTLSSGY